VVGVGVEEDGSALVTDLLGPSVVDVGRCVVSDARVAALLWGWGLCGRL